MKHVLSVFICIVLSVYVSQAQQGPAKADIVLKTNGDELAGKVVEISEADIRFQYAGESVVYTIRKTEILKITFSSGRIEFFNRPASSSPGNTDGPSTPMLGEHHNKVAVLPFSYTINRLDAGQEITYKVQNEAFTFLNAHKKILQIQDPNTTNALLIKAGVANGNIRGFTMAELCNILGVEYLIQGSVTQNSTNSTTTTSNRGSYSNSNSQAYVDKNGHVVGNVYGNNRGNSSSSSVSTSMQNYQTSINMNVFDDKGQNIFSQDHTGFWNTNDAYKITLQFLLKRTPIYKR